MALPASRTDYCAVNGAGVTVRTFEDRGRAFAWVRENAPHWTDLHVEEVTVAVTRRRIYTPRALALVGAVA